MKRRRLSLVLVLLVVVALGALVIRRAEGPSLPDGPVQVRGTDGLRWEAFQVGATGRVVVQASGSEGAGGTLEATAWILDRATRRVVWRMSPVRSRASTGTRRLQTDTLSLPAGTYEAYFSGIGTTAERGGAFARMTNRSQTWRNDEPLWYLVVRPVAGALVSRADDTPPAVDDVVWHTAPQSMGRESTRLDVTRPASVRAVFVASEIGSGSTARITRVADGAVVWEARATGAAHAGGALRNRRVEATVALAPGLYDVESTVSHEQAFHNWSQTPPDDPFAWGLTLRATTPADASAVSVFDLWSRTPVVRYEARTPDTDHVIRLDVASPTPVVIAATGELTGSDGRFDYAWLERANGVRVWEMAYDETESAGGDSKNRSVEHLMTLEPGAYTLHFVTDGTHHVGEFNTDPPDHPERYGVVVFSLGAEGAVRLAGQTTTRTAGGASDIEPPAPPALPNGERPAGADVETGGAVPAPPPTDGALAAITRVGGGTNERERFRLDAPATVRVYATGERLGDAWYDWAQIEDEDGRVVWTMKQAATQRAGGADKNRLFDGTVELPAGSYRLVVETDGGHHYGAFDRDDAPEHDFWGAIVRR